MQILNNYFIFLLKSHLTETKTFFSYFSLLLKKQLAFKIWILLSSKHCRKTYLKILCKFSAKSNCLQNSCKIGLNLFVFTIDISKVIFICYLNILFLTDMLPRLGLDVWYFINR